MDYYERKNRERQALLDRRPSDVLTTDEKRERRLARYDVETFESRITQQEGMLRAAEQRGIPHHVRRMIEQSVARAKVALEDARLRTQGIQPANHSKSSDREYAAISRS